jgi:hypothetical protein
MVGKEDMSDDYDKASNISVFGPGRFDKRVITSQPHLTGKRPEKGRLCKASTHIYRMDDWKQGLKAERLQDNHPRLAKQLHDMDG